MVLAKDILAYAAGNLVVILDPETQKQSCFRSLGGGGIGAIAVSRITVCLNVLSCTIHGL